MATIFLTVRVTVDQVDTVLRAASGIDCEARTIGDKTSAHVLIPFQTMTIDDEAAHTDAAEQDMRERVATALTERGISHELIGIGADASSLTKSLFTIKPIGSTDDTDVLEN